MWTCGLFVLLALATPQDFDKDGVADVDDDCPTDPGNPANKGCPGDTPPPPPPPPATPAKIEVSGDRIEIDDTIEFKSGSARVDPKSFQLLAEVAAAIRGLPGAQRVSVEGHTDNRGSAKLNRRLSKQRARAVVAHLVRNGVDRRRLKFEGHGEDDPIATNDTPAGRKKNRRVDFLILP
ncbi:MAG: OmpA family protein [Deltaproteobacteria bacterium]|jgi:OOP family OmpA-OmpF porin